MNERRLHLVCLLFLFTTSILFSMSIQAQNNTAVITESKLPETSKLTNTVPSHIPLIIEFENADAADLLGDIRVKVTNNSNKPIYFLLFDITPLDVLSPRGIKYSFQLSYGRRQLRQPSALAQSDDTPILPGENKILALDEKLLEAWAEKRARLGLAQPLSFDFRLQHLSHGDGSGYFGSSGAPFTGRYPTDPKDGKLIKNDLTPQSESKKKGIDFLDNKLSSEPDVSMIKSVGVSKPCSGSNSKNVTASFFSASEVFGFLSN